MLVYLLTEKGKQQSQYFILYNIGKVIGIL